MKEAISIKSCSSSRVKGAGVKLEASWSKKLAFGLRSDKFRPISDATHASGTRTENRDSKKEPKSLFFVFLFSLFSSSHRPLQRCVSMLQTEKIA
jgi:hypothetical protein